MEVVNVLYHKVPAKSLAMSTGEEILDFGTFPSAECLIPSGCVHSG